MVRPVREGFFTLLEGRQAEIMITRVDVADIGVGMGGDPAGRVESAEFFDHGEAAANILLLTLSESLGISNPQRVLIVGGHEVVAGIQIARDGRIVSNALDEALIGIQPESVCLWGRGSLPREKVVGPHQRHQHENTRLVRAAGICGAEIRESSAEGVIGPDFQEVVSLCESPAGFSVGSFLHAADRIIRGGVSHAPEKRGAVEDEVTALDSEFAETETLGHFVVQSW